MIVEQANKKPEVSINRLKL